jgi:hypothetical protein
MDSNHRSPKGPVFVAEGELRNRTGAAKKGCFLYGTDGSNPSPSSGESGANLISGGMPEIYVSDSERRHGLDAAVAEYQRLLDLYPSLGYEVTILPKVSVPERADFVLHSLAE